MKKLLYFFLISATLHSSEHYRSSQFKKNDKKIRSAILTTHFKKKYHQNDSKKTINAGALATAINNNQLKEAALFLKKNPALINIKTKNKNRTALFYAKTDAAINFLMTYNPDVTVTDSTGRRAFDVIPPNIKKILSKYITPSGKIIPLCTICITEPCTPDLYFTCDHMTTCASDKKVFLETIGTCPFCRSERKAPNMSDLSTIEKHQQEIEARYREELDASTIRALVREQEEQLNREEIARFLMEN